MPRLLYLLGLLWLSLNLPAQAHSLQRADSGKWLVEGIELLEDPSGQWQLADILQREQQKAFRPANGRSTAGMSRSAWWLRVPLQRSASAPNDWLLEVAAVSQLDIQLYRPSSMGWQRIQSGEISDFASGREIAYRHPVFHLPALGEQPIHLYLRLYDPAGNSFPLRLWQADDLQQHIQTENLLFGMIFGGLVALLLYNLILLLSLRDDAYFWYVLSTTCVLLVILGGTGYGFQYLWPNQPLSPWLDRVGAPALWGLCVCRFSQRLLQSRRYLPRLHRGLNILLLGNLLILLANLAGWRALAATGLGVAALLGIPLMLCSAWQRWRQGYRPALFFLLGHGLIFTVACLMMLRSLGLLDPEWLNTFLFPASAAAETVLFSFALAYRIQLLRQEKAAALELANQEKSARLQHLQNYTLNLQAAVDERTHALAAANQQLREREQALQHAAFHDPLTGLANRRLFLQHAADSLAEAQRLGQSVALLLIDLDHFKPVNDRHGHSAGDWLLGALGQRLQQRLRGHDLLARLGGDEFAVLLRAAQDVREQALQVALRIQDALGEPYVYQQQTLHIGCSIGIALYPEHARHLEALYQAADDALYQAKADGRGAIVVCPHASPEPVNSDAAPVR